MGIFDEIRKAIDSATKPAPRAPAPGGHSRPSAPPSASAKGGLAQAQQRRRAAGDVKGNDGRTLTRRRLAKYESLERALVLESGAFPWTDEQARAALARRGFDPAHVAAYLRSPAARRLLE